MRKQDKTEGTNLRSGKRYHLSYKKIKQLARQISEDLSLNPKDIIGRSTRVEVVELPSKGDLIFINGKALFIRMKSHIIPSLLNETILAELPSLTIDKGAISHICNGADIMAPGVVKINGEFEVTDIVVVNEECYFKIVALAKALYNSTTLIQKNRGKIAQNLHFIGDSFWEAMK